SKVKANTSSKNTYTYSTSFTKAVIDTYLPFNNPIRTCKELSSEHKQRLEKKVSVWDFSPLNVSHEDLIHCSVIIISQVFSLSEVTLFTTDQLYDFITDLSSIYYNENPYHNFAHAVDVLQCIYYFLCQMGLVPLADGTPNLSRTKSFHILRPRDIFALFIAAIGHDTAHPGVNNAFLINTSAPLALLYNDNSVLESFHAMTLFQLLKKHKFDQVLGGQDSVEYTEFRKLVITTILATDMALHSDYVTRIKEQKERLVDSDPSDWDAARCLEERLLFCSGLIKCADISNVARPFPRTYEWAQILVEEFASQGDLERELGMDVLPMNDRSQIVLEDSQIGFIRFVALGLFESVSDYMQGMNKSELSFPVKYIEQNLSIWQDRKQEHIESNHHTLVHDRRHNENTQSTTTTVVGSSYQKEDTDSHSDSTATSASEDNSDYHTQAVDAIGSKPDYNLPKMPAVAMTSLSHPNNVYPTKESPDFDHVSEWEHRESSGPVYCQCTIQ
ncbi:3',5'-cyclic-nucleotide phosphodiesterase, partial [Rhizopus stolonifer]